MSRILRNTLFIAVLAFGFAVCPVYHSYAEVVDDGGSDEDVITPSLSQGIQAGATANDIGAKPEEHQLKEQVKANIIIKKMDQVAHDQVNTMLTKARIENAAKNMPLFLDPIVNKIASERVISTNLSTEVKRLLDDTNRYLLTGYNQIQDTKYGTIENLFSLTYTEMEAGLLAAYNDMFCIPESKNASDDCIALKGQVSPPYENFIDFFTSTRTWNDVKIVNVLLMARRFFNGATDRIFLGQGISDPKHFVSNQSGIAQANLRMAILDELAAWRAPTSKVADTVGKLLLQMLAPSGMVQTMDYNAGCSVAAAAQTAVTVYTCSLSTEEVDKNNVKQRVMSQASIDKIMQYDYMMSKTFYDQINSPAYVTDGPIERVKVYLKAQQLAQDYRALRLLQMKVAATAMNMINGK